MTIALITTNPKSIIQVFVSAPNPMRLPNGDQVSGTLDAGWTSQDGTYALVDVTPFMTPAGQVNNGEPSYSFDANGNVVETYPTQPVPAAPAPTNAALAQAALYVSDGVAIRCFKAGVPFPADWLAYTNALRGIVGSGSGAMPVRPAFPSGT